MDEKLKSMCDLILEWFTEATYQGIGHGVLGQNQAEKMQAVAEVAAACVKAAGGA